MTDSLSTSAEPRPTPGKGALWTGRIIAILLCLWMIALPIVFAILAPNIAKEDMAKAGFPEQTALPINLLCICFAVLFAIPRTSILGALLLTAYLGGAAATHIRQLDYAGTSLPIIFGVLIWSSLLLRDPRLRVLLPIRR